MAGQTRTQSIIETTVSIAVGFFISWIIQVTIIPVMIGAKISNGAGFWVTMVFTVSSLIRGYWFRRLFNWLHHKK